MSLPAHGTAPTTASAHGRAGGLPASRARCATTASRSASPRPATRSRSWRRLPPRGHRRSSRRCARCSARPIRTGSASTRSFDAFWRGRGMRRAQSARPGTPTAEPPSRRLADAGAAPGAAGLPDHVERRGGRRRRGRRTRPARRRLARREPRRRRHAPHRRSRRRRARARARRAARAHHAGAAGAARAGAPARAPARPAPHHPPQRLATAARRSISSGGGARSSRCGSSCCSTPPAR